MDMNKSFYLKVEQCAPQWHVIDATDKVLGRLSTEIADVLRGKNNAFFTPSTDSGDYVIVTNCDKIKLTGNKWEDKIYQSYSGWRSGLKELTAQQVYDRDPRRIIIASVKGMLPKNKLSRQIIKKLKVYVGGEHPHTAQVNTK